MKQLTIDVTQEDIDNGVQTDIQNCAIALGCKKVFGDKFWYYYNDSIELVDDSLGSHTFKIKDKAVPIFMQDFDKGNKVEPFSFVVEVPDDFD